MDPIAEAAPALSPAAKLAKVEADLAALEAAVVEFEPVAERVLAIVGKFSPVASRALAIIQALKAVL